MPRQLGDAGVLELGALARLTHLHMGRTRVRDGGLRVLRGMPALKQLNLASNDITDAGVQSYARAHCTCIITALPPVQALHAVTGLDMPAPRAQPGASGFRDAQACGT